MNIDNKEGQGEVRSYLGKRAQSENWRQETAEEYCLEPIYTRRQE